MQSDSTNALSVSPSGSEGQPVVLAMRAPITVSPRGRYVTVRAPRLRRAAAEIIDALLPLPFLAALFWPWALVCIAYEMFCDSRGASVGKKLMGLQTVIVPRAGSISSSAVFPRRCNAGRSLLRNFPMLVARLCFLGGWIAPLGVSLLLIEGLLVVFSPSGRRLGDRLAGTQVTVPVTPGREAPLR